MVGTGHMGYDEYGDGTKTPPNAPHCLLLWRKPPLSILAEAFFKAILGAVIKKNP